ncbi:MAG: folate family ECF transporter S component [Oscillospiraceae bacterium]|nr:folate family ECF transporter S component [Oscillospiraceae bacterium]
MTNQPSPNRRGMTTKTLAYCALLAALSVVLARLFNLMPNESTRFSIEAVPIFLAGMLFGPLSGGLVGFAADFVGCLFSPYGYNPIFCVPPILYGVFGGLFRYYLNNGVNPLRLTLSFLPPVILGSILYQSCTLAYMYYDGVFFQGLIYYLSTRSVQFAITLVLDVLIIYLLFQAGIFRRIGIWPLRRKEKKPE